MMKRGLEEGRVESMMRELKKEKKDDRKGRKEDRRKEGSNIFYFTFAISLAWLSGLTRIG